MSFNFNPAKIKNVYALLAAFVVVVGTFFIMWIKSIDKGNLENKGERILMGFLAVIFFIIFLVFPNIILSQNSLEDNDTGFSPNRDASGIYSDILTTKR